MALAAGLAELQAEARCPLCLDTLREPVTLDCGHNCCDSCLQQRWEHLLDTLPCPVCQHRCPRRNVKRNSQLALLADLVRQLPGQRVAGTAQEPRGRCDAHQQPLSLFCEEDLELLCGQCGASAAHRGHALTPMGQAAAHHRRKLKGSLERLRQQLEEAERELERQDTEFREKKEQLKEQRHSVCSEARQLKHFLQRKERSLENKMFRELVHVYRDLMNNKGQLARHSSTLKNLLADARLLSLQADPDLLVVGRDLPLDRGECVSMDLHRFPANEYRREGLSLPPNYIGLDNMMAKFQVNLTLDAETAHADLLISRQRVAFFCQKATKPTQDTAPQAFTSHMAVLGVQGFLGGRHFWLVELRGQGIWSLGVCKKSFPRQSRVRPIPRNGCWQFVVSTSVASPECLQIGLFLDHDLGEISFYNWSKRAHMHTIKGLFRGKLLPYFSIREFSSTSSLSIIRQV